MDLKIISYCVLLVVASFYAIKYFISIAPKIGLVDIPNGRSSHKSPTPRGAGLVIGLLFFLGMFIFQTKLSFELVFPMLALFIVFLCGVIDDLKNLSSKIKFLFIIIATLILIYDGYIVTFVGTFLGQDINLGYLAIPFTIFAMAGFTNALNLIDGLDGLAGGISSIILFTLLIIGVVNNDTTLIVIPSFLISILIGFLLLNWNPAQVFMGDSGSLFLGFIIAFLSFDALQYITPTSVLFLAAIPILDTMVVFRRRVQRGKSPFSADKNHMHHILYNMKRNKSFTVNTLIMMQGAFCLIFLQIINSEDLLNLILFGILYLIFFNLFDPRARKRHNKKKKKKISKEEVTYLDILKRKESVDEPS